MDEQFLVLRSPQDSQQGVFQYYSGGLKDWNGEKTENALALLNGWNSQKIQTFDDAGRKITCEELEKLLGNFRLDEGFDLESTNWADFSEQIDKIQDEISQKRLEKVVLSRVQWVGFDKDLTAIGLLEGFKAACEKYSNSLVYLLSTLEHGIWMGASPEILVELHGMQLRTMSLAGTLFSQDEVWTEKEKQEQSITAKHISGTLTQIGLTEEISKLTEINNGRIRHLVQYHTADIDGLSLGKVLSNLHPTPAVAGYPIGESVKILGNLERHQRLLYTGFIGNTQEVYVNLRCAQIFKNGMKLYAGCGINSQSNSEREWQETELKMKVIGDLFVV